MRKTSTFRAHIPAGVERENFKIDYRSLFGVGPADIMHVERNVTSDYVMFVSASHRPSAEIQV